MPYFKTCKKKEVTPPVCLIRIMPIAASWKGHLSIKDNEKLASLFTIPDFSRLSRSSE